MQKIVIVGGGPIGLYLVNKLIQLGVNPTTITVVDPRIGNYTRPGHINASVFNAVFEGLRHRELRTTIGHIKDIEEFLFARLEKTRVNIIKGSFVGLEQATVSTSKSLRVALPGDSEDFIECDMVFDCSGMSRIVANNVNAITRSEGEGDYFTMQEIVPNILHKRHLLKYIQMEPTSVQLVRSSYYHDVTLSPQQCYDSLLRLRSLGWKGYESPHTYQGIFNGNEVALYTEVPDTLPQERESEWVQASLFHLTGKEVPYAEYKPEELPTLGPKTCFFNQVPKCSNHIGFQHPDYPIVILCGDALMGPDYRLAHGITSGVERINLMLSSAIIFDGGFQYFDLDDVQEIISRFAKGHKERIVDLYKRKSEISISHLHAYAEKVATLVSKTISESDPLLVELKAMVEYQDGLKALELGLKRDEIVVNRDGNIPLAVRIIEGQAHLLKAVSSLPITLEHEAFNARDILVNLIPSWKRAGNACFRHGNYEQAITAYKQGESLYHVLTDVDPLLLVTLYSNMIITYHQSKQYDEAVLLLEPSMTVLEGVEDVTDKEKFRKKILENVVIALIAKVQRLVSIETLSNDVKLLSCVMQSINESGYDVIYTKHSESFQKLKLLCQQPKSILALLKLYKSSNGVQNDNIGMIVHFDWYKEHLSALIHNPDSLIETHEYSLSQVISVVKSLKSSAGKAFKAQRFKQAELAYKLILETLQNLDPGNTSGLMVAVYSNLLICHSKLNQIETAIEIGRDAMLLMSSIATEEDTALLIKIRFNLAKNLFARFCETNELVYLLEAKDIIHGMAETESDSKIRLLSEKIKSHLPKTKSDTTQATEYTAAELTSSKRMDIAELDTEDTSILDCVFA